MSGGRTKTHNNDKYVRKWWEVENYKRWQPYANGGEFRKWYGNNFDVVDWSQEATELYASKGGLYNKKFVGKSGICWNLITSAKNGSMTCRTSRTCQTCLTGKNTIIKHL